MAEEESSFDEEASGEEEVEMPPWNENVIVRPPRALLLLGSLGRFARPGAAPPAF